MLNAEAATISGHTRAVHCDKSISGFECDVGCMSNAEPATIPGHTRTACSDELRTLQVQFALYAIIEESDPADLVGETYVIEELTLTNT